MFHIHALKNLCIKQQFAFLLRHQGPEYIPRMNRSL